MVSDKMQLALKKREVALERARELKERINEYLEVRDRIPDGMNQQERIQENKARIMNFFRVGEKEWQDWRWQMAHRIKDPGTLANLLNLSEKEMIEIERVGRKFRWAISPYYLSLMDWEDPACPIRRQAVPSILELSDHLGHDDPMGEEFTSPAPAVTRRYPDRLIINVTNVCAMFCRHCQRRRNFGEVDCHTPREKIQAALDYIRQNPEIRDVLITGGDALLLSDQTLDWILSELDNIPHVEIKRIGTRAIVTMPQRITPKLCSVLEKHPPIYINTQFNHPLEVTPEAKEACDRLIKAGVVLGNQAVLLNGINNNPHIMKKLNQMLLKIRVRPYYIFHAKQVRGTAHFITSIEEGLEIMEQLRGYTSGLAVPAYIINAPMGYGKTPILPDYLLARHGDEVTIRTWEKRILRYPNIRGNKGGKLYFSRFTRHS